MAIADAVVFALHVLFGGLLAGGVVFTTWATLPLASSGDVDPETLSATIGRLTTLSRASAVVLLLTGGHMAASRYTFGSLFGTTSGYLVVAMLLLWLVLTALVEIGASRIRDGVEEGKVRTPARDGGPMLKAASALAVLVLVDAGLLASGAF